MKIAETTIASVTPNDRFVKWIHNQFKKFIQLDHEPGTFNLQG